MSKLIWSAGRSGLKSRYGREGAMGQDMVSAQCYSTD